jgi:ArsR family transcriptional regulator, arsenate/arsenite/antimonite-responsive transcriptional repressor
VVVSASSRATTRPTTLGTALAATTVGLSEATVSHHLKQLLLAGLATKRRDGMNVYYRLVPESITAIARTLAPGCC